MTRKRLERLPHGASVQWTRTGEECTGKVFHDITITYVLWTDGQQTYATDDAALKFVEVQP